MKAVKNITESCVTGYSRRNFFETGIKLALVSGVAGVGILSACSGKEETKGKNNEEQKNNENNEKFVSPPEDLMQEHGLLNRILLIYDTCKTHLINKETFPIEALNNGAYIIRTFVENYHEKQEENYLFPRFEKANTLTDLVQVLRQQHTAGRFVTDQILDLTKTSTLSDAENQRLIELITAFNTMYRPHEAREDTVLFPAFRKLVSNNEYHSLGEQFEKNEHKLFGEDGFQMMVDKVAGIEKTLGIYELTQFTPKLNRG